MRKDIEAINEAYNQVIQRGQSPAPQSDHDPKLKEILRQFSSEVVAFANTGELEENLYEALFDYYSQNGEMPYGVAKARTGDPYDWVAEQLARAIS